MGAMSFPSSDSAKDTEAGQTCELCSKSYQRRDLLMRHRRRCRGPKKSTNRRKACDACVQAKTKCCYTQPTCTRCAKRGTRCVYTTSSASSTSDSSEQRSEEADTPNSSLSSSSAGMDNLATPNQLFELELSGWDLSAPSYPLESFDMSLANLSNPSTIINSSFPAAETSLNGSSEITPSNQTLSQSPASTGLSVPTLLPPSSVGGAMPLSNPPSSSTVLTLVSILGEYASLLIQSSFSSPFLHLSQYPLNSNVDPDLTFLPLTSMAICCCSGINLSADKRFFRRALAAARQRLIGNFPSLECMQQWDAIHAMLIYESLEMKESIRDESEAWKLNPPMKGLGSPFLQKMTESYLQSYPEIRNLDYNVFSDPKSSPCAAATSTWARWRITETARRTLFFANMLNFFSNYDQRTGKQLPYYQSLNDDLILNMPLPCSQAAWVARDEESWRLAMKNHLPSINHLSSSNLSYLGNESLSSEMFLRTILSKFTKEDLRVAIGTSVGFGDSDELRRLIILCACEQFS